MQTWENNQLNFNYLLYVSFSMVLYLPGTFRYCEGNGLYLVLSYFFDAKSFYLSIHLD